MGNRQELSQAVQQYRQFYGGPAQSPQGPRSYLPQQASQSQWGPQEQFGINPPQTNDPIQYAAQQQPVQPQQPTGLLNQLPPNLMPAQGGYATTPDFREQLGVLSNSQSVNPQPTGSPSGVFGAFSNPFGTHPEISALRKQLAASQASRAPTGNKRYVPRG